MIKVCDSKKSGLVKRKNGSRLLSKLLIKNLLSKVLILVDILTDFERRCKMDKPMNNFS